MQKLPWLPRPLIIFAMIAGVETPCVQWYGQDSEGNNTDEQKLFPIYGAQAKYIECVRPEYWGVSFLGTIQTWNKNHPECPLARLENGEMKEGDDHPIIRIAANELYEHEAFRLTCPVIQLGEQGGLYSPATYENPDAEMELPHHRLDRELQDWWRRIYQQCTYPESIEEKIGAFVRRYSFLFDTHSSKYLAWEERMACRQDSLTWVD